MYIKISFVSFQQSEPIPKLFDPPPPALPKIRDLALLESLSCV